jgi:hypothetical protein
VSAARAVGMDAVRVDDLGGIERALRGALSG